MILKEGQESAEANDGPSTSRGKRKRRSSQVSNDDDEVAMPQRFFTSSACDAMYAASDMFAVTSNQQLQEEETGS
eukprot:5102571-Ditylum_brightwellii.AAC.1